MKTCLVHDFRMEDIFHPGEWDALSCWVGLYSFILSIILLLLWLLLLFYFMSCLCVNVCRISSNL